MFRRFLETRSSFGNTHTVSSAVRFREQLVNWLEHHKTLGHPESLPSATTPTWRAPAVPFGSPQGRGQHLLRNAVDATAQLVEAHLPVFERYDRKHGPFVADAGQRLSERAARLGR